MGQKDERNGECGWVGKKNEIGNFIVAGLISRIMQNLISSLEDKQQSGILMHQTFYPGWLQTESFWLFTLKGDFSFRKRHDKKPYLQS